MNEEYQRKTFETLAGFLILPRENSFKQELEKALSEDFNVNYVPEGNTIPLIMLAAKSQSAQDECVELLLDAGADIGFVDEKGRNLLSYCAINSRSPKLVDRLLNIGLEVNRKDEEGYTAFGLAVEDYIKHGKDNSQNNLVTLLKHGADPFLYGDWQILPCTKAKMRFRKHWAADYVTWFLEQKKHLQITPAVCYEYKL